jgi:hypothetical protein
MENSPRLRGAPKAKGVEFHDELVAGNGAMHMHEEVSGSDTERVHSLQGLAEILT